LDNLWGPFSFVLSPIFDLMDPATLPKNYKSFKNLRINTDDDMTITKKNIAKISPRSSLTVCEEKLILEALVRKVNEIVAENHKEFNPIAQATPFHLKKKPAGQMVDYLNYLCFTTLAGNWYVLAEAIRLFELVSKHRSDIVHENTIHRYFFPKTSI
jgi:hypothetical protein